MRYLDSVVRQSTRSREHCEPVQVLQNSTVHDYRPMLFHCSNSRDVDGKLKLVNTESPIRDCSKLVIVTVGPACAAIQYK